MGAAMNVTATGGWRTGAAAPSLRAVTILPAGRRCRQPRHRAVRPASSSWAAPHDSIRGRQARWPAVGVLLVPGRGDRPGYAGDHVLPFLTGRRVSTADRMAR